MMIQGTELGMVFDGMVMLDDVLLQKQKKNIWPYWQWVGHISFRALLSKDISVTRLIIFIVINCVVG